MIKPSCKSDISEQLDRVMPIVRSYRAVMATLEREISMEIPSINNLFIPKKEKFEDLKRNLENLLKKISEITSCKVQAKEPEIDWLQLLPCLCGSNSDTAIFTHPDQKMPSPIPSSSANAPTVTIDSVNGHIETLNINNDTPPAVQGSGGKVPSFRDFRSTVTKGTASNPKSDARK